jgi:hypothetical protein
MKSHIWKEIYSYPQKIPNSSRLYVLNTYICPRCGVYTYSVSEQNGQMILPSTGDTYFNFSIIRNNLDCDAELIKQVTES